jgi:iron(III) transport system substrate-binding protein
MSRRLFLQGGTAIGVAALVGCSSNNKAPSKSGDPSGEVVIYSSASQPTLDALSDAFNKSHQGITLRGLFGTGSALVPKIEAERRANKLQASLVMLPNPVPLVEWRDKGVLLKYTSPEEAAFPEWFKEPGWWIGIRVISGVRVHNRAGAPGIAPGWEALADPKYKGKVALTDGATISTAQLLYWQLKDQFGADFWPAVARNKPTIYPGTAQLLDRVMNGGSVVGDNLDYQPLKVLAKNANASVGMEWSSPTPVTYSSCAILADGPNPEAAKVVFDWLASKEGQQLIVDTDMVISARSDVQPVKGGKTLKDLTWKQYDFKDFADRVPALGAEWQKTFNRG